MDKVYLNRLTDNGTQTTGQLWYKDKLMACTLELPWKDNKNKISCIPKGTYKVVRRNSAKYGDHFHLLDVPKRSYILIHHANYHHDLLGCIGVGKEFRYLDKDAHIDITSSRDTMKKLLNDLPLEFELVIK